MKLTTHLAPVRHRRASVSLMFTASVWVAAAITSSTAMAAGLNDTGFTTCADAAGATVSCTAASAVQGQDARYGRDAAAGTSALTKVGSGANGFDFTKISNAGAVLPATAPLGTALGEWACTYDNTTGLMWEVKTTSGLRSSTNGYSWYNTDAATNGGSPGYQNGGTCNVSGRCDTEKFAQDVNATRLCGHSDWKLPTFRSLMGIVRFASPSLDQNYFPDALALICLHTGTPRSTPSSGTWSVYVDSASISFGGCGRVAGNQIRLVRSGLQ